MGAFLDFLKTVLLPATFSLFLYLLITFAILPVYRRYRQRYAQYLPLNAISTRTSSLRERVSDALLHFLLPTAWRRRALGHPSDVPRYAGDSDGSLFGEEEGEGMVGFDVEASRRDAMARQEEAAIAERRLSRDLEEGFRDESDDDARGEEGNRTGR